MDEYLDQVGSLNPRKVDDTSFKDVQNFVKGEVDYHQKCLDDACDEKLKVFYYLIYTIQGGRKILSLLSEKFTTFKPFS